MAKLAALALIGVVLAGCAAPTAAPTTPAPLPYLATTPAMRPWVEASVRDFAADQGMLDFFVTLYPAGDIEAALRDGEAAMAVAGLDPPPGWFATPLGAEPIGVVVHLDNPVEALSSPDLAGLFSGRIQNWRTLGGRSGDVQTYMPLPGDELRDEFAAAILGEENFTSDAILAPSPRAMLSAVSADPNAIGLLPFSLLDGAVVKMVAVDGILPDDRTASPGEYPLRSPVVAFGPEEPEGPLRVWLGWVQANQQTADQP